MWQRELPVVALVQRPDPRVEELHGLCARLDLGQEVIGDQLCELVTEGVPTRRVAVHHRLRLCVVSGRSALDGIGGQGERRAGETDEWHPAVKLLADQTDRLQDVAERVAGLHALQPRHIVRRTDRGVDDRALALDEIKRDPHRLERQQEIGEEDRGIDVETVDRLEGHLGGQLGLAADLEQRVLGPDRAVLGHIPPSLPHEPDRGGVDRLPPAGTKKAVVHDGNGTTRLL